MDQTTEAFGENDEVVDWGMEDQVAPAAPAKAPTMWDTAKDAIVTAGARAINPIGGFLEQANEIPVVQDVVPDALAGTGSLAKGMAKGGYNAARNTLQLGADVQDYILPGDSTPVSDALSAVPSADYEGATETVAGNITEIASGFLLGNKAAAATKAASLGDDAVKLATKLAPKAAEKIIKYGANLIKSGLKGIAGTAVTTAPGSTNFMVGKEGDPILGSLIGGLPTDSPDAAQNALAARINTAIDGFIVGAGIGEVAKFLRWGSSFTVGPAIYDKLSPLWSETARFREFFDQVGKEAQKIPGAKDTVEWLKKFHTRAAELASNPEAGVLKKDLGVPGVAPINEKLDTATTVGRQINKDSTDLDIGIRNTLEAQSKKLGQKGYEKTAGRREAPTAALNNALEQTEVALGGTKSAETGAKEVQRLGKEIVTQGKTEGRLAKTEATNTLGTATAGTGGPPNIIESVNRAKSSRTQQVNELYDKIPDDVKYEGASINKIIAEDREAVPDEIIDLLGKDSDGSFKFLNNKVRPRISAMIKKLEESANPLTREQRKELTQLKKLRENIDKDQVKVLTDAGRSDVVTATKTAKEAYEKEIAQNRQGVVGEIQDLESINTDDAFSQSRKELKKVLGKEVTEPEHEKRLYDVLASDEGGRNEQLIERYRKASNKAEELDKIEEEIYGNKLREFYDQRAIFPGTNNPNGVEAFEMLLDDPQNADRIKYIVDLAKKDGTPAVNQALKYTYARALKKKLYTGHQTELGNPVTNAPGVQSVLNNEGFIKAGEQIYKDTPEFMVAVKDTLELANEIQKAAYKRAAPVGGADMIVSSAEKGLRTAISPILGPLSHKGYIIKTFFRSALDVLKPQVAVDRMADALMADGQEYAKAYKTLMETKGNSKKIENSIKYLSSVLLRTNGEREKFDKKFKENKTNEQTDEVLGKSKTAGPEGKFEGQLEEGNVDLTSRKKVDMGDGSFGTVYSESREEDGHEVLYPRIVNGKLLSSEEAWKHYKKTGENLGKFDTPEHADAYAQALHEAQEKYYK